MLAAVIAVFLQQAPPAGTSARVKKGQITRPNARPNARLVMSPRRKPIRPATSAGRAARRASAWASIEGAMSTPVTA